MKSLWTSNCVTNASAAISRMPRGQRLSWLGIKVPYLTGKQEKTP